MSLYRDSDCLLITPFQMSFAKLIFTGSLFHRWIIIHFFQRHPRNKMPDGMMEFSFFFPHYLFSIFSHIHLQLYVRRLRKYSLKCHWSESQEKCWSKCFSVSSHSFLVNKPLKTTIFFLFYWWYFPWAFCCLDHCGCIIGDNWVLQNQFT